MHVVSKNDQNLDRQLDQLKQAGCYRIYQEKNDGDKERTPGTDSHDGLTS